MKLLPVVIMVSFALFGCEKRRTPAKHLILLNFEGVVITVYEQKGFPELPTIDGFRVHTYPDDGILITSSKQEFGWASDKILDVLDGGSNRVIPRKISGERVERDSATGTRSGQFVPPLLYYLSAIGSDRYWSNRNAIKEYDKKVEEALAKIKNHLK